MKENLGEELHVAVFDRCGSVSAWIKAMRFGDFVESGYWMTVLVENGIKEEYLAKCLAIFTAEDTTDTVTMTLANSILLLYAQGLGDGNMLWQVLYRCCRAPKFWETDAGRDYELESDRALARYQQNGVEELPVWAVD